MPSSREYLDFIMEQLSGLEDIRFRAMMGEFIIYYRGRIAGGIYDNRFLVKPTVSAVRLMPGAQFVQPYEGAKQMILVDNVDDREFLRQLFEEMYPELPAPKQTTTRKKEPKEMRLPDHIIPSSSQRDCFFPKT